MNTLRVLAITLTLLCACIGATFADEPVLPGVGFISPDGRYCVQLELVDGLLRFMIKDTKTEHVENSIESTGPLYLRWAADSKSFVIIEHISKGSYGRVVYLAADRWLSVQVEPPFKGKMDYHVVNLQLGPDRVYFKFAVTKLSEAWTPIDHSFCDLEMILASGKVSSIKWTSASEAELVNAPGPDEPVCVPAMKPGTTVCGSDPK
jgi:hypothetical protein